MKRNFCKSMSYMLTAALLLSAVLPSSPAAAKKKTPALSVKKASIEVGKKKTIKVKNTSKKATWSVKSGKNFVTLSNKKKNSVVVTGKKAGTATILAKVAGKKLTCKITVTKKTIVEPAPTATATAPVSTAVATAPGTTQTALPSPTPEQPVATDESTPTPTTTPNPAFVPSSGFIYEGLDTMWLTENIDPSKPVVAMSFDDGPGGYASYVSYGTQIQEALKEAGAHATFFYIGAHIEHDAESRQEVENAWKAGFEVANHSYDSSGLNIKNEDTIREKIEKTDALLSEITGYSNFLFRAPNVAYNDTMFEVIDKPFIDVSIWSNDYQDTVDKDAIVKNVTSKLADGKGDGGIINMHSVHEKTAQAVPEILAYCKENGYQVVSVSELFAIKGKPLEAGVKYFDAN